LPKLPYDYRDLEPSGRKDAYSQEAVRLGKSNDFCLLTTLQLYKMYSDLLQKMATLEKIDSSWFFFLTER